MDCQLDVEEIYLRRDSKKKSNPCPLQGNPISEVASDDDKRGLINLGG
jgi:hypothetical protein